MAELHIGDELSANQRQTFRLLLHFYYPEILQPLDSPHVSRQWDHPIEIACPMKRQRLHRQLKDAVEAALFVQVTMSLARQLFSCVRLMAHFDSTLTTVALMRLCVNTHPRVDDTPMS
jgi:hypothetical protein